jgi:hypothetical protein
MGKSKDDGVSREGVIESITVMLIICIPLIICGGIAIAVSLILRG